MDILSTNQPRIPADLKKITSLRLEDKARFDSVQIEDLHLTSQDARLVGFQNSVLNNAEMSSCRLKKASITDVVLNNCLLFGTDFDDSDWHRVRFKAGLYSAVALSGSTFEDVTFEKVKLNLANFRSSRLKRVLFQDCDLTEADFGSADLSKVSFIGCNLSKASFAFAKLSQVDLRGSNITDLKGINGLRGATIDNAQLISLSATLASEMGIEVE